MLVEPGDRCQLHCSEGVWKDTFWEDLHLGLSDPGGEKEKEKLKGIYMQSVSHTNNMFVDTAESEPVL